MYPKCNVAVIVLISLANCLAIDLEYTPIQIVDDESRFTTKYPDAKLTAFSKVRHIKGNYIMTMGERINGDRMILNFLDKVEYAKATDIEVSHKYPARGVEGMTITCIEYYLDITSDYVDAFLVNDGGVNTNHAEVLLACNKTKSLTYDTYWYGY